MTDYLALIIGLGIALVLFFVLRGVNLWYWKIDTLVKNQEKQEALTIEQNKTLKNILTQLGGNPENSEESGHISTKYVLNEEERKQIEQLSKDLKKGELIVRVKQNGKIEKWREDDWNEIVKIGNEHKFDLVYRNQA